MSKKQPKQEKSIKVSKTIKTTQSIGIYEYRPVWSFKNIDHENEKWGIACEPKIMQAVIVFMKKTETMTWRELLQTTSGRNGTRNHSIAIDKLNSEAIKRIEYLNFQESDIVSLAVNNRLRLWGFLRENGLFEVLWIDPRHEVYPVEKKHT